MSHPDVIRRLSGVLAPRKLGNIEFFRPLDGVIDFACRTVSIGLGLPIFTFSAAIHLLGAVINLGRTLIDLFSAIVTKNLDPAKISAQNTLDSTISTGILLVKALVSPLANLIDLIGACILTTVKSCHPRAQFEELNQRDDSLQPG